MIGRKEALGLALVCSKHTKNELVDQTWNILAVIIAITKFRAQNALKRPK